MVDDQHFCEPVMGPERVVELNELPRHSGVNRDLSGNTLTDNTTRVPDRVRALPDLWMLRN